MLSQEEINALLGSIQDDALSSSDENAPREKEDEWVEDNANSPGNRLTPDEIDALGEVGNISMGTAATTLFSLLNHKVLITAPKVEVLGWKQLKDRITNGLVGVCVNYTHGFSGSNLMILKERDVKVIADLMMGGDGSHIAGDITDLHLSAIAESMNQMIGSSSTALSQIFNKTIDISPPQAIKIDSNLENIFNPKEEVVQISFSLQIQENIIDSDLMQILPLKFAKELIEGLLQDQRTLAIEPVSSSKEMFAMDRELIKEDSQQVNVQSAAITGSSTHLVQSQQYNDERKENRVKPDIDVKSPQFESFDKMSKAYPQENMDLLMDVSLEVSVELGRTRKKIKEILEYGPGSIIELDRLVGEPVDVLVNGKFVATGEVVVIDESFGIRITDIIKQENRL